MYPKINLNDCEQVLTGRYETAFHNDGTDFIDYGRPTWAVNNLRPSVDSFTIEGEFVLTNVGATQYFLTFGADGSSPSVVQFGFLTISSVLRVRLGGVTYSVGVTLFDNQYYKIRLEATDTNLKVYVNDSLELDTPAIGSYLGTSNLYFGGRTDGATLDPQGYFRNFTFWKGVGDSKELLEHFPLNGTPNGVNGTVGTITDGSPEGVWNYKFCRDVSDNGLYALEEATPTILPVADSDRVVGTFNGSNYLTIPKAQTITSEYKLFFEAEIIPTTPNGTEVLYYAVTPTGWFNLYIDTNGTVVFFGNGVSGTILGNIALSESNKLNLYLKDDALKVKINGVWSSEFSATWNNLNISNYLVGRQIVSFPYTGKMLYFRDHDETFTLNNTLTGSLGTTATLTGSTEAVFFADGISYKANLNPTGSALIPYPNSFETKATLETYGDNLKTYVSKNTDSIFHNVTKKNSSFDPVAEFFTNKS